MLTGDGLSSRAHSLLRSAGCGKGHAGVILTGLDDRKSDTDLDASAVADGKGVFGARLRAFRAVGQVRTCCSVHTVRVGEASKNVRMTTGQALTLPPIDRRVDHQQGRSTGPREST